MHWSQGDYETVVVVTTACPCFLNWNKGKTVKESTKKFKFLKAKVKWIWKAFAGRTACAFFLNWNKDLFIYQYKNDTDHNKSLFFADLHNFLLLTVFTQWNPAPFLLILNLVWSSGLQVTSLPTKKSKTKIPKRKHTAMTWEMHAKLFAKFVLMKFP